MKNLFGAFFILLIFSLSAFGRLAVVPLDEAIKDSDLIIIGTLQKISQQGISGNGEILIERLIAGNIENANGTKLKERDKLQLNYVESFACVSGSHKAIENKKGVFLLTLKDSGEIESEDFRSLKALPEIEKLLKTGVKPNALAKTINLLNDSEQKPKMSIVESSVSPNSDVVFCPLYSEKSNVKEYYPLRAFSVILLSMSLYFLLYRSRFKIR